MTNRFEDHVTSQRLKLADTNRQQQEKVKYLLNISTESKGTPLASIFDSEEVELAAEFMRFMKKHDYPMATNLKLEQKIPRTVLSSTELSNANRTKKGLTSFKRKLLWKQLWSGRGYRIALLSDTTSIFPSTLNTSSVFLCSDLKLRCARVAPCFGGGTSYARGMGNLPVKLSNDYKLRVGTFVGGSMREDLPEFKNQSLEEKLKVISERALEGLSLS